MLYKIFTYKKPVKKRGNRSSFWKKHSLQAKSLVLELISEIDPKNEFVFNRVVIRNQKTRWGSCSSKKNLNFNYRIIFLDKEVARYLVAHELCHLRHLNHSKEYWSLVESYIPNYKNLQKQLKRIKFTK